jgi:hypothetical protein
MRSSRWALLFALLVVTGISIAGGTWFLFLRDLRPSFVTQRPPLDQFVNQDLRTIGSGSQVSLKELLGECLPERYRTDVGWAYEPWYLWRQNPTDDHADFILFEGQHIFMIPGVSRAAVHFLDSTGGYLGCSDFSTGWRIDLDSAIFRSDKVLGVQLIEILTKPIINGCDIRRQVYGVFDHRLALLRLEDSSGQLVVNNYYNPNHTIGPNASARMPDEWEQSLLSIEPARVLEALTWLGGEHRTNLTSALDNIGVENVDSAKTVVEVRNRPNVRNAIDELCQSENQWIKEAAQTAQRELAK